MTGMGRFIHDPVKTNSPVDVATMAFFVSDPPMEMIECLGPTDACHPENKTVCLCHRDEDHLALFIELLGKMPRKISGNGRFCKDFFNRHGELRHIKSLRFWPLDKVLTEKYSMPEAEVFLTPCQASFCMIFCFRPCKMQGKDSRRHIARMQMAWLLCNDDHLFFYMLDY